jgi:hypothetical protein
MGFAMFKPTENDLQNVCTMLGLMTLIWAWAENALAISIGIIDGAVKEMRGQRDIPISLKRRVKYLRTALADVPELESLKERGNQLANDFIRLSVLRNELVHGSTWQLEKGGFESLGFAIIGRQQTAKQKRFTIADAVSLNVEITKLANDATAFLLRVSEIFPSA